MLQGYGSEVSERQVESELSSWVDTDFLLTKYARLINSEGQPLDNPLIIWEDYNTLEDSEF